MRKTAAVATLIFSACFHPVVSNEAPQGEHPDAGPGGADSGQPAPDAGLPDAGGPDAGRADSGEPPEADAGTVLFGTVRASCAPNDGPAFHFQLTPEAALSCEGGMPEGLFVDLWRFELEPGTYALGPDFTLDGTACICAFAQDRCEVGTVLRIDTADDAGVTGRLDGTFGSGAQVHSRIEVRRCPGTRTCG